MKTTQEQANAAAPRILASVLCIAHSDDPADYILEDHDFRIVSHTVSELIVACRELKGRIDAECYLDGETYRVVAFEAAQIANGEPHLPLTIIDMGDFRIITMLATP